MTFELETTTINGIRIRRVVGSQIVAVPINKSGSAYDVVDLESGEHVCRVQRRDLDGWLRANAQARADAVEEQARTAAAETEDAAKAEAESARIGQMQPALF